MSSAGAKPRWYIFPSFSPLTSAIDSSIFPRWIEWAWIIFPEHLSLSSPARKHAFMLASFWFWLKSLLNSICSGFTKIFLKQGWQAPGLHYLGLHGPPTRTLCERMARFWSEQYSEDLCTRQCRRHLQGWQSAFLWISEVLTVRH